MNEKSKRKRALRYRHLKEKIVDLPDVLRQYCQEEAYNIFLYMHFGDDFYKASVYQQLQETYKRPVHYIVQPNEVCIMQLWGIENYSVFDIEAWMETRIGEKVRDRVVYEYLKHDLIAQVMPTEPQQGAAFICHPHNNRIYQTWRRRFEPPRVMSNYVRACLGIMKQGKVPTGAIRYPEWDANFREEIESIAPLDKIILIAPEVRSDIMFNPRVWHVMVQQLHARGFTVIENVMDPKNHIKQAVHIKMSVEQALQLGTRCKAVFAARSGLCDLLAGIGDRLHILWPYWRHAQSGPFFSMRENFDIPGGTSPHDYILSRDSKPLLMFEGVDLLQNVRKSWLPRGRLTLLERILSVKNEEGCKVMRILGVKIILAREKVKTIK